uniref:Uncharacterized protein n=1 Tax=Anguilla anguilla TaxID=7936 RepID=A0A0E9VAR7_ANGAN
MMLVPPEKGLQGLEEVVCKNHLWKWIQSVRKRKYIVHVPRLVPENLVSAESNPV